MSTQAVQALLLRVWGTIMFPRSRDDKGATLVEYVLLVALIAIVCVLAVTFFGRQTSTKYSSIGNNISSS